MKPSASAAATTNRLEPPESLTSWYAEGFRDRLGDRLLMYDNSGTPSVELLRFRPAFASAPGFEDAVRDRVEALRGFEHRAFGQVRAVERLDGGDLVLASTSVHGKRLSEVFRTRHARTAIHPAFAAWLIRELTSAVAELHRQGGDIAHGALIPDRVLLAPDGRLMIVEHVLGSALARLQLSATEFWQDLGLVADVNAEGAARIDQRTDVVQVGWIALSLLVGRPIARLEYPDGVEALLDEFTSASRGGSKVLVSAVRRWLQRALHQTGDTFESAIDAQAGLADLRVHGGSYAIALAASRGIEQLAFQPPPSLPALTAGQPPEADGPPDSESSAAASRSGGIAGMAIAADLRTATIGIAHKETAPRITAPPARRSISAAFGWGAAAIFALIAAGEGVWIARFAPKATTPAPALAIPVVLESPESGDRVMVDGRDVGVTPVSLSLSAGTRSIRVLTRSSVSAESVRLNADRAETGEPAAIAQAAAKERRGGLRLMSPVEVQVLEGERVLGTSTDGPIVATAGRHELDFVNSAFGYRVRMTVNIRPGEIVPMTITPPDGRVSVNAVPWAQVSIDGRAVGETPLANLPMAVGEHEIAFRHPQLGEQTQHVIVKSNAVTRVSATFAR
jgi:hypothetical protein